jgi:hypothetical protein
VYSYPKRLYYPVDYFVGANQSYLDVLETFIGKLESEYGIQRVNINFTEIVFSQNAVYSNMANLLNEEGHYQVRAEAGVDRVGHS